MTNAALHDLFVQRVADHYRGRGYQVTLAPTGEVLPPVVGRYRPDLVAVKPDESVVVEISVKGDRSPSERFGDLARQIGQQPGWRFVLVVGDPVDVGMLPVDAPVITLDEVVRNEAAAAKIAEQSPTSAFLLLWVAAEALLRMLAHRAELPLERVPTSTLIRDLYSFGELSATDFHAALDLQQIRDAVAHGFQADDVVGAIGRLQELLANLNGELRESEH